MTVWYKSSPTTGTNTLQVDFDNIPYGQVSVGAYNFTGSSGIGVDSYNNASALDNTTNLTISSNSRIIGACMAGGATSSYIEIPSGTNKTKDWDHGNSGVYSWAGISSSLTSGLKTIKGGSTSYAGVWGVEIKESTPVPIDLLSFNAKLNKNNIDIYWETVSERNNDYYIKEKSFNGENWEKITKIKAIGNSNSNSKYFWTDTSKTSSLCYYKLTQVDFDGTQESFDIISVSKSNFKHDLKNIIIYPNPTSENFTLEYNAEYNDEFKVVIETDNGSEIFNQKYLIQNGINIFHISSNEFKSGLYLVRIENKDGQIVTLKIIKE